jgi:hypothetical protein
MSIVTMIMAAGLGAALKHYLDPNLGRRRRARAQDQLVRLRRRACDASATTARDLGNRARGLLSATRQRFPAGPVDDQVLAERVRAQLGYAVGHPRSIQVQVQDGSVWLSGPVLAAEVSRLLRRVRRVRGVQRVDNHLTVYEDLGGVPGLQGEPSPRRSAWQFEWMQENWSPTARLLAGLGGSALVVWALAARRAARSARGLSGTRLAGAVPKRGRRTWWTRPAILRRTT